MMKPTAKTRVCTPKQWLLAPSSVATGGGRLLRRAAKKDWFLRVPLRMGLIFDSRSTIQKGNTAQSSNRPPVGPDQ